MGPESQELVRTLKLVLESQDSTVGLHEPSLVGREKEYLNACIDTGWVSSAGQFVTRFEESLKSYTGAGSVTLVCNGTTALFVALVVAGIGPEDEVLVPGLSFVATANAVVHAGAVPHFIDSDEATLGMSPDVLTSHLQYVVKDSKIGPINRKTGRRIAALVPMHTFGHPVRLQELKQIADNYGIRIIEDAAEGLGSWIGDHHVGTTSSLAILSFNGNKIITTGGGGAILTRDPLLGERIRHLTSTAKVPHDYRFIHDEIGWNYRMPNINAALGLAQMERLPQILRAKRQLAHRYQEEFADSEYFEFVTEQPGTRSNYWLNTIILRRPSVLVRNEVLECAIAAGLGCRAAWDLLPSLPMFSRCPTSSLHVAKTLEASIINVPSGASLKVNQRR